jgi:hypothetical protein
MNKGDIEEYLNKLGITAKQATDFLAELKIEAEKQIQNGVSLSYIEIAKKHGIFKQQVNKIFTDVKDSIHKKCNIELEKKIEDFIKNAVKKEEV